MVLKNLGTTLRMIKFEHTVFALPFAYLGAILAADGIPGAWTLLWITLAMVGARSAAMSFNRIADREIDAENPRTADRELPSGKLSVRFAWIFMIASCLLFFLSAAMLNRLALLLSPIALISVLGYSYTKRFTALSHLLLGWSLAIAPTGAWIAVTGTLASEVPLLLSLVVMMWTAGFDVLYSLQDVEFDRRRGLKSIPVRFGAKGALRIARLFHFQAFAALVILYLVSGLGIVALIGVIAAGLLMIYQHSLIRSDDLSRLNAAFFTANAMLSVILFLTFGAAELIANGVF